MKVALLVSCLSLTSLISCSTINKIIGSDQKVDAAGLATSPRGDGADVIDPYSLDTKADHQAMASSSNDADSLSLDAPSESSSSSASYSSDLQTEVQMDQAPVESPVEHTPVAEVPAMNVAPQSEMADASQTEYAVSGPIETPEIEVFDNNQVSQQSIAQEQSRVFKSPKKQHVAKVEKLSKKQLAAKMAKDKKAKKAALAKKEKEKKSKLAKNSKAKKEKLAKNSKGKKGMVAKSSKSKKEKVVKSKSSKSSKVVSSKTTKKGKKDRKVASSK